MAEPQGFEVLQKRFDFTLPITGQKGQLRFTTRNDRIIALEQAKGRSDDVLELTYLGRAIVELGGRQGPLSFDDLKNYPEKDLMFLRAYDLKLNSMGEDDFRQVLDSFEKALKS